MGAFEQRRGTPRQTERGAVRSGEPDIFAAWPLGAVAAFEGDRLALVKFVEGDLRAGRIVKEVFGSVSSKDEPESLATDQTFDGAVESGHRGSFALTCWLSGDRR